MPKANTKRSGGIDLVKSTGRINAKVFNYSSPVSRVSTGNESVKPEEGKIIKWGAKDDLPHEYLRLISDSGTASSCMRRVSKFIFADGFQDKAVANREVNELQTADALLQDMAGDAAAFSGVALRVRLVDGEVMAENLPFECVRKLDNGFYFYNPTLGQAKVDKALSEILPGYSTQDNLREAAAETPESKVAMAETGQIYYYFEKTKGAYEYPVPVYAATGSLADMETDAEIALYVNDDVKSGFRLNAILTAIGDFSSTIGDNGEEIPNPDLEGLKTQLRSFTTREGRGEARKKVLLLTAPTQEMIPKLEPFNNSKALELLTDLTDHIANKVCRNWSVPPVLVGLSKPGQLGQSQEIANMIKLFQMDIVGTQNWIQRIFAELWPEVQDWATTSLNPIDYFPPEVLAKMTDDEIRAMAGLPPVERPTETEITVNALNSLPADVRTQVMATMTEDEKRALIGLKPLPNDANQQTATA